MARYTVSMPGNTALQTEVWTLTLAEAKAAVGALDTRPGTYWERHVLKPYLRARRTKTTTMTVYTAGLSTGELSNVLAATGSTVEG